MKKSLPFLMAFLSTLILFSAGNLFAEKTLYDDFSTGHLDGKKWFQRTYVREILDGQFVSKLGNRSPGMGAELAPGSFRNHSPFINPNSIHTIECEITIVETKLDSAPNSASFAQVPGYFYNINDTGGAAGDIFSNIVIGDRGNGGLEAWWTVQEVLNDDSIKSYIASHTIIGPGTLNYNTPYNVKISYDKSNNQFSFEANGQSDSYPLSESKYWKRDSQTEFKSLSTTINATNGSNNGYVFAKFDNVYINDEMTVYDDFSSPLIDLTKWNWSEWVRDPSTAICGRIDQGLEVHSRSTQF